MVGFSLFWLGVLWDAFHGLREKLHDPAGWIVDRAPYAPARIVAYTGIALFTAATVLEIARLIFVFALRLIRKSTAHST
jgi:hypothetical protein